MRKDDLLVNVLNYNYNTEFIKIGSLIYTQ